MLRQLAGVGPCWSKYVTFRGWALGGFISSLPDSSVLSGHPEVNVSASPHFHMIPCLSSKANTSLAENHQPKWIIILLEIHITAAMGFVCQKSQIGAKLGCFRPGCLSREATLEENSWPRLLAWVNSPIFWKPASALGMKTQSLGSTDTVAYLQGSRCVWVGEWILKTLCCVNT